MLHTYMKKWENTTRFHITAFYNTGPNQMVAVLARQVLNHQRTYRAVHLTFNFDSYSVQKQNRSSVRISSKALANNSRNKL